MRIIAMPHIRNHGVGTPWNITPMMNGMTVPDCKMPHTKPLGPRSMARAIVSFKRYPVAPTKKNMTNAKTADSGGVRGE